MDRIYNVVQDMAKEVQNQGEMVDIIDENILMAQKNVESTNDELDEAKSHQKKSRKKYIILIVVLIFIVVIVVGLSFMWKKWINDLYLIQFYNYNSNFLAKIHIFIHFSNINLKL